jgi:hypothetical protein
MAIIPGVMEDYYVVMEHWLEKPGIEGRYQSLANSYGKSFGVSIGFQFPFYGHYITNLTVSTGGFW